VQRLRSFAVISWSVVSIGGCAAITGLDNIQEQACAPDCDGGPIAEVGADITTDQSAGETSTGDQTSDTHPVEAGSDVTETSVDTGGGGMDALPEAPEGSSPDAPFDSGCGDLNTTANCGACGDKCAAVSTSVTSASCPGDTNGFGAICTYTCATGYLNCNAGTPPNTGGCECNAPGATASQCCTNSGGDCPFKHNNGLNQTSSPFWDCVPTGTINAQLAEDACDAYVTGAGQATSNCQLYGEADASTPDSYCSGAVTGDCVCWTYSGQYVGQVFDPKALGISMPQDCYYGSSTETFD
jgi:hypothetical protein